VPFLAEDMYQNLVRSALPDAPQSVHLTDWPAADESLIDSGLLSAVRAVQRIVSLGRAARAKANIKVRQPLASVYVRLPHPSEAAAVRQLADQLLDELNVKQLHVIENESEFFDYQVRPNLPVLGPKYGSDVGRIQRALAAADKAALAREATAGRAVTLDGIELQPDELLVTISGKPGYAVAEEAGYAIAVTTEITPELADEGLAREMVRRIQEMRKAAGFDIADRIRLYYAADKDVARVLTSWREYIVQETLAEVIAEGAGTGHREEHEIDGRKVMLTVSRVAR
jgi:isoleucyl-tRNA synthetase